MSDEVNDLTPREPVLIAVRAAVDQHDGEPYVQIRFMDDSDIPVDAALSTQDAEDLGVSLIRLAAGATLHAAIEEYANLLRKVDDLAGATAMEKFHEWFSREVLDDAVEEPSPAP